MRKTNYYKGFEGQPELQFDYTLDGKLYRFTMWIGYFDKIMDDIEPTSNGWTGLAYYYHLNEGWYEENNWPIPDLSSAIEQLRNASVTDNVATEITLQLSEFLQKGLDSKRVVTMLYL
jgi:hypothetical protein